LDYCTLILYDLVMAKISDFRTKPSELSISAVAKVLPAGHTEVPLDRGGFPVTEALELDLKPAWEVVSAFAPVD
jgi:hypothetical protein